MTKRWWSNDGINRGDVCKDIPCIYLGIAAAFSSFEQSEKVQCGKGNFTSAFWSTTAETQPEHNLGILFLFFS